MCLIEWIALTMTLPATTFDIPMSPKVEDCQKLHAFLQQAVGTPVVLNCKGVARLGGLVAQIICMAAKTWAADGVPLHLVQPTDQCRENLEMLGLGSLLEDKGGIE